MIRRTTSMRKTPLQKRLTELEREQRTRRRLHKQYPSMGTRIDLSNTNAKVSTVKEMITAQKKTVRQAIKKSKKRR